MSMYTHILDTAIEGRPRPKTVPTAAEALSVLSRCHARLNAAHPYDHGADWTSNALANQIAYDVALIELARCVGIACDAGAFEQPEVRRAELTRELAAHGFCLDELDQSVWSERY
jgi:hypothetical protein